MKRNFIVILIIGLVVAVIFTVVIISNVLNRDRVGDMYTVGGEKEVVNGSQIVNINTSLGTIKVNNAVMSMKGEYVTIRETDAYQILYYEPDQSFQIAIYQKSFFQNRALAEQALIDALNITNQQACSLTVSITTTPNVDPVYSGTTMGLSFCP